MEVYEYLLSCEESLKWTLEELHISALKCWCLQLSPHLKHCSFLEVHDTAIKKNIFCNMQIPKATAQLLLFLAF